MSTRRKVRPGRMALADDGRTIELHYESLEVTVLPNGEEVAQSTKQGIKRIKCELLDASDLYSAAQSIVQGCKLLHAGRGDEVSLLLEEAQRRRKGGEEAQSPTSGAFACLQQPGSSLTAPHAVSEVDRQQLHEEQQQYLQAAAASATQAMAAAAGSARLSRIDEYLEALYEEDPGPKTAAAAAIALLLRDPAVLGVLAAHPTLLQALARLLREDAKKSSELSTCLLMAFFALSHLPHAHFLLVQNQVGSLTMDLLDLELRRAELWQQQGGVAAADVGARMLRREPLQPQEQRLAVALARQEPLVYAGISLLLSMAEDAAVEQKMVKKGLLTLLVALLSRGSVRLLVLVTTFLRKLSVAADNNAELRELEVVGQLAALLPGQPSAAGGSARQKEGAGQLLSSVLRLLHNLSFDRGMRQQMVAAGMIGKVASLLELELDGSPSSNRGSSSAGDAGDAQPASITSQPAAVTMQAQGERLLLQQGQQKDALGQTHGGPFLQTLVLGLLYHLSLQDKHRSMFLYTDAVPKLHAMLLRASSPLATTSPELAALVISLAGNTRLAEEMARLGRLEQLLALVLGPADAALQPPAPAASRASGAAAGSRQEEAGAAAADSEAAGDQPEEQQQLQEDAAQSPQRAAGGPGWNDALLWKLLQCMAQHDSEPLRLRFGPALARMAALITAGSLPQPVFAAALGCLAWLDIPGHDYSQLLAATQLHTFLAQLAAHGGGGFEEQSWERMRVDLVHALGVLCACEASAEMLVSAGLVEVLHSFILESEDGEALLAATVAAARFMAQGPTRAALLVHAELAAHFAEMLQHRHRGVARAADAALDAIAGASEEWRTSVQRLKFEAYNREWLQVVRQLDAAVTKEGLQVQPAGLGGQFSQAAGGARQQLVHGGAA